MADQLQVTLSWRARVGARMLLNRPHRGVNLEWTEKALKVSDGFQLSEVGVWLSEANLNGIVPEIVLAGKEKNAGEILVEVDDLYVRWTFDLLKEHSWDYGVNRAGQILVLAVPSSHQTCIVALGQALRKALD